MFWSNFGLMNGRISSAVPHAAQLSQLAEIEYAGFHQLHIRDEALVGTALAIVYQLYGISVHFLQDDLISHKLLPR